MADLNKVILQGRLTKDVELRHTQSGKSVASFSIAVNGYNNTTEFINVVAWGKQGEFAATYFGKGKQILVEGRLANRSYEDKQGNKRTVTDVVADGLFFCGSKSDDRAAQYDDFERKAATLAEVTDDGDLPF